MQVGLLSMSSSSEGSREPFPSLPVQSHRVYQPRWMMACSRCPGPCDSLLTSQMNRGPHLPKAPKHTPIQRARFLSFMYQICGAVSIVRIIDALFPLVCHITHARVTSMYSEFFFVIFATQLHSSVISIVITFASQLIYQIPRYLSACRSTVVLYT